MSGTIGLTLRALFGLVWLGCGMAGICNALGGVEFHTIILKIVTQIHLNNIN